MTVSGAVVEAHARAVAASVVPRATKGIPGRTMDMLTQELMFVLEGSDGAAERCAAMESLFWLQVRSRASFTHSFIYSLTRLRTHSLTHSLCIRVCREPLASIDLTMRCVRPLAVFGCAP